MLSYSYCSYSSSPLLSSPLLNECAVHPRGASSSGRMTLNPGEAEHGAVKTIITQSLCLDTFEEHKLEEKRRKKTTRRTEGTSALTNTCQQEMSVRL